MKAPGLGGGIRLPGRQLGEIAVLERRQPSQRGLKIQVSGFKFDPALGNLLVEIEGAEQSRAQAAAIESQFGIAG